MERTILGSYGLYQTGLQLRRPLPNRSIPLAPPPPKPKKIRRHLPHLDFLAPLRNPIPPMMPPDMLKRPMPTIPVPAMHLYRAIRSLAAQPVRPVVAHADFIPETRLDGDVRHGIHFYGGLADEEAQHFGLGSELDEGELDGLVVGEGGAEGAARVGVGDGLGDTEGCGAEGGGCLADAIFVDKGLGDAQAGVDGA